MVLLSWVKVLLNVLNNSFCFLDYVMRIWMSVFSVGYPFVK